MPRYERHVEDAAASDDPARMMRGLRQWTLDVALGGVRNDDLDDALQRAQRHADQW